MNFLTQVPTGLIDGISSGWSLFIIFCATTLGIILALSSVVFLIFRKLPYHDIFSPMEKLIQRTKDIFILAITAFASFYASVLIKDSLMIGRPVTYTPDLRPLIDLTGYGFPSSHAAFYSAIAISMFFINRTFGIFAIILAVIVGVARVFAGVHSPLDIIGGFMLGLLISSVIDFIVEKLSN